MLRIFNGLSEGIDKINESIGSLVSWANVILIGLVCFDVVNRRWFDESAAWINELEWHLFALIFLLGAGYTLKHDKHVRVDLFYSRFSKKDKALVNFIGHFLFLIPWAFILCLFAMEYAKTSLLIRETSPDPGGLPARYIIKFAIVLGMALLSIQGLSELIKAAIKLWGSTEKNSIEK